MFLCPSVRHELLTDPTLSHIQIDSKFICCERFVCHYGMARPSVVDGGGGGGLQFGG